MKIPGRFSLAKAIIAPGIFLSHPPIVITPSYPRQPTTVSMESAMTSRDTREYFIPVVPIEIPSETVIVLNSIPLRFSLTNDLLTMSARPLICILHGVTCAPIEAMPTRGFLKSSSVSPTPLSIDREAA